MAWIEKRLAALKRGKKLNFIEKLALESANPVSILLGLLGVLALLGGMWEHEWAYIFSGLLLILAGHISCWLSN